jgi:UDPglucose 6-dehydrogenase
MRIGIVGFGPIGKAQHDLFSRYHSVVVCDPPLGIGSMSDIETTDAAVICVPTPLSAEGGDYRLVAEIVERVKEDILLLCASTIPIGSSDDIITRYGRSFVYVPQFFGETPNHMFADLRQQPFLILGGYEPALSRAVALYQTVYSSSISIAKVPPMVAETVKYVENAFIATKVIFCNEILGLCDAAGIDYDLVRELWLMDPRVSPHHTFVYREDRGFGGKCIPKDTAALSRIAKRLHVRLELIETCLRINDRLRSRSNQQGGAATRRSGAV